MVFQKLMVLLTQWKTWSKMFVDGCVQIENIYKDDKVKMDKKIMSFNDEVHFFLILF